jgi:hypothetical protein
MLAGARGDVARFGWVWMQRPMRACKRRALLVAAGTVFVRGGGRRLLPLRGELQLSGVFLGKPSLASNSATRFFVRAIVSACQADEHFPASA